MMAVSMMRSFMAASHGRQTWCRLRLLHFSSRLQSSPLPASLKQCYTILRVTEESEEAEIRESYIKLVKEYHPDSGSPLASADEFTKIDESYKLVMKHHSEARERAEVGDIDEVELESCRDEGPFAFPRRHKAPQHRQYLSYMGVGSGTPSQREKQYRQHRFAEAHDNVSTYQVDKIAAQYEGSLVTQDKKETKKRTVRSEMDRLVEDLIQESMARGDFDNLPGMGKPLPRGVDNPMIDSLEHNLNKVLLNHGYAPEWVMLKREIRQEKTTSRNRLLLEYMHFISKSPPPTGNKQRWIQSQNEFRQAVHDINKKITTLNLTTPTLTEQMMVLNTEREFKRVMDEYEELAAADQLPTLPTEENNHLPHMMIHDVGEPITLKVVIRELRALFTS